MGRTEELPAQILARWPELSELRYRRGGFPLRVGGWMLGQSTVAAITLGKYIFLAPGTRLDPELLLHELKHVHQFSESKTFPLHYIWESLRRGYHMNRFEVDARTYAAERIARANVNHSSKDV
jgi:hypothetical protein